MNFVTLVSRAVGAFTVLSLACVGLKNVLTKVWSWKAAYDANPQVRIVNG